MRCELQRLTNWSIFFAHALFLPHFYHSATNAFNNCVFAITIYVRWQTSLCSFNLPSDPCLIFKQLKEKEPILEYCAKGSPSPPVLISFYIIYIYILTICFCASLGEKFEAKYPQITMEATGPPWSMSKNIHLLRCFLNVKKKICICSSSNACS